MSTNIYHPIGSYGDMRKTANTLPGRLLCACNLVYGFDPVYAKGSGIIVSTAFLSPDCLNAALVGTNQDGVVVAFRGTLTPCDPMTPVELRLRDWIDDFREDLVPYSSYPGKVHAGFLAAVNSLWPDVVAEIERQLAKIPEGSPVYFTGHSKGGGMAPIAAMRWAKLGDDTPVTITFAAPKCGDADFAKAFAWPMTRYEYHNDIVPFLPPNKSLHDILVMVAPPFGRILPDYDYHHAGRLKYLGTDNEVVSPESAWEEAFLADARVLGMWGNTNLGTFAHDHSIAAACGYWNWICPELNQV